MDLSRDDGLRLQHSTDEVARYLAKMGRLPNSTLARGAR
jgi:hypothetical protein